MRTLILLFLTTITAFASNAQIGGTVKDADGNPVSGVTISLLKDSAMVKFAVTKESGNYNFNDIKEGTYRISATHIGYATSVSAPFSFNGTDVNVNELVLAKATADLQGVTVTAKKQIIEVQADKTILNVEGTINATGSNGLELLRKAPGVLVDKDENLSLSGKNGVQVFIDGRPSPLSGQDLADFLKTMQATQIEAIEIITNPSAKYEAAGNAGIINIRLKKNKSFGTNGSVNAGFNQGIYPKYNTGFSLNHRNQNINIYGNYNFNNSKIESNQSINRSLADTIFKQTGLFRMENISHSFKAGADYTFNKKSSIGAIINGNFSEAVINGSGLTSIITRSSNKVDRFLAAENNTEGIRNNVNFNLNYNYTGTDGKSLVLNADHGYHNLNRDQLQPNVYTSPSGAPLGSVIYQMITPTEINISSIKVDYEQGFAKGKLGIGGKLALINTDNDFQRYDVYSSGRILDKDRSNNFHYKENINAGYVNYNRAFEGFMIQAGLRVENTISEGTSNGLKKEGNNYVPNTSGFERNYTDFFPSAAITFNKNPMKHWGFTYSRRIDRPYYQDLNPFEFKLDEYTFQKGNTTLKPQYTNTIGITHTYKYKLNMALNYSHVKDIFTQIIDTTEKSKSFISKQNLATQDVVSLNVSYPFMYKNFTSFMNLNTNYSYYKANFGEGREVDLNAFGLSFFQQNSLKFGKTKTWTVELTAMYNAPTVHQGTFKVNSIWGIDAGVQKVIMKGKGTIKASVSDVFKTMKFTGTTDFAGQKSTITSQWESRQFKLAFNFRFGNNQVKAARSRNTGSEEENKRVQSGGGIGIGQ